jgi:transposase InsO family protein
MQGEDRRRLVAPISLRERILTLAHFPRVASHTGRRRLYRIVAQHWCWPALARDAALFVKRFVSCQASRAKRAATQTVPLCLFPPSVPMELMSMGLLGPLPKTPRGNLHILVMTDRFSKLVVASDLPIIRAITVAMAYIEGCVAYFGPPVIILTDNGSQFRSKLMAAVNKILGVKATNTTAYRPRTNGQVERFNSTLCTAITHYAATQNSWELELAIAIYAYNRTPNEATGYAPF